MCIEWVVGGFPELRPLQWKKTLEEGGIRQHKYQGHYKVFHGESNYERKYATINNKDLTNDGYAVVQEWEMP